MLLVRWQLAHLIPVQRIVSALVELKYPFILEPAGQERGVVLAAVHYLMTVRSDYAWAGSYAMVVILILALRFVMWRQTRGPAPLSAATRKPATTDYP